jgi:type IV fimbrial biogenesis protein FimT
MGIDCEHGHSLFELLMTLALIVLVLGAGVPSLGAMVAHHRLRTDVDALFHAVHHARKASIVRRRVMSICPTRDGTTCGARDAWSAGWMMYVDVNLNGRFDDEPVLRHVRLQPTNRVVANRSQFSLRATRKRATNGTVIFCDQKRRARSRALVVSYTGRPRVAYEDPRGRPYECAD